MLQFLPLVLQALGGIARAGEARAEAKAARQQSAYEAAQLRSNAVQAVAASQRDAFDVERQAQLNASRALAVAASSGGGASDPTVINLIAQNAADGAYRKAVTLYQGEDKARDLRMQADATEYGGMVQEEQLKAKAKASWIDTGAQMTSTYARGTSMRSKYG